MIIYLILFLIILGVSFILALKSIGELKETPTASKVAYGLFLIQRSENLTTDLINDLYNRVLSRNLIISFERLFKGDKQALVIFGPTEILESYRRTLDLIELEDYSQRIDPENLGDKKLAAWEVGPKRNTQINTSETLEYALVDLKPEEEFWWQINLQSIQTDTKDTFKSLIGGLFGGRLGFLLGFKQEEGELFGFEGGNGKLKAVIRAVLITNKPENVDNLKSRLTKIGDKQGLTALPQAYLSSDILNFYKLRSMPIGKFSLLGEKEPRVIVPPSEVLNLILFKSD